MLFRSTNFLLEGIDVACAVGERSLDRTGHSLTALVDQVLRFWRIHPASGDEFGPDEHLGCTDVHGDDDDQASVGEGVYGYSAAQADESRAADADGGKFRLTYGKP